MADQPYEQHLPPTEAAHRDARAWVGILVRQHGLTAIEADAVHVADKLVASAVPHTPPAGRVTLTAWLTEHGMRLECRDPGIQTTTPDGFGGVLSDIVTRSAVTEIGAHACSTGHLTWVELGRS